jgi:hypothetical protein
VRQIRNPHVECFPHNHPPRLDLSGWF